MISDTVAEEKNNTTMASLQKEESIYGTNAYSMLSNIHMPCGYRKQTIHNQSRRKNKDMSIEGRAMPQYLA